jgi:hypothetical protein
LRGRVHGMVRPYLYKYESKIITLFRPEMAVTFLPFAKLQITTQQVKTSLNLGVISHSKTRHSSPRHRVKINLGPIPSGMHVQIRKIVGQRKTANLCSRIVGPGERGYEFLDGDERVK